MKNMAYSSLEAFLPSHGKLSNLQYNIKNTTLQ